MAHSSPLSSIADCIYYIVNTTVSQMKREEERTEGVVSILQLITLVLDITCIMCELVMTENFQCL